DPCPPPLCLAAVGVVVSTLRAGAPARLVLACVGGAVAGAGGDEAGAAGAAACGCHARLPVVCAAPGAGPRCPLRDVVCRTAGAAVCGGPYASGPYAWSRARRRDRIMRLRAALS